MNEMRKLTMDQVQSTVAQGQALWLVIDGVVYDVSGSPQFYGAGGMYQAFAGQDCTWALARGHPDPTEAAALGTTLTAEERGALEEWKARFDVKYPMVGVLEG